MNCFIPTKVTVKHKY